jgi:predicted small lipoprotein YifL
MTPRRAPLFLIASIAALIVAGTLAGCGNKGPLYLPDRQPESAAESGKGR